jgi:hypothetical protein
MFFYGNDVAVVINLVHVANEIFAIRFGLAILVFFCDSGPHHNPLF